jgi:hypothetical protein
MAFQKAAGYQNLPTGVFSPTLFSKKVQLAFRKSSVIEDITNNDYFGEISAYGDSVKIIKEPAVTVRPYARGTQTTSQELLDSDFTLIIDRANYFQFRVDDIETSQSHVNWADLASNQAAYRLRDGQEKDVLGYLMGYEETTPGSNVWVARTSPVGTKADALAGNDELLAKNKLTRGSFGQTTNPGNSIVTGLTGTYDATPLQILNRMSRRLDQENVPKEGRWLIIDPVFKEMLSDENSKLISNDYSANQDAGGMLRNGKILNGMIRGFRVYESLNLPLLGTGPDTVTAGGSATNYGFIVAGHDSAVATATQLQKTEKFRDPDSFGDIVRGMQLYGRKILRPEALVTAAYSKN